MSAKDSGAERVIILIEDDYSSRLVLKSFLEDRGYELKCYKEPPAPEEIPDNALLIVDVRLGGQRAAGIQFVLSLPEDKIKLPLILISNWGRDRIKSDLKDLETKRKSKFRWMDKPIQLDLLEGEMDEAVSC